MIGAALVLGFVLLAVCATWIAPQDPIATNWGAIRKAPSAEHWFGTDEIGREVQSASHGDDRDKQGDVPVSPDG